MSTSIPASPLRAIPAWATLQRALFSQIEAAWPRFVETYCEPDGRLHFGRSLRGGRDGVDDFYEAFFNWPAFYALGGSDEILRAAKHHWEGVTRQLAEDEMLTDEFENGYDWFHQGESLIFFYGICAADPDDVRFRARAHRFARLYIDPEHGNYDPEANIIRAPHTGALGALPGFDREEHPYPASQANMAPYGLPLDSLPGIETWEDLADPANATRMGAEMYRRAQGDTPVNLAATSLVVNSWLYDGDDDAADWVIRYVDGWRARAEASGGIIPDNVGPSGDVGELHDGHWFGGHYGWTWPHGLPSVGMGALIGGINASLVSGDQSYLELARVPLDTVLGKSVEGSVRDTPMSLRRSWLSRLGTDAANVASLVPHRVGRSGWFDFGPMPLDLPTWLWWYSREDQDRERLARVIGNYPEASTAVKPFRDKGEAGHEAPWISFLAGENEDYPVRALEMALGQLARRLALIDTERPDPERMHIHFWQSVNPVVTEVLQQLISGSPQILYNGGLPLAAVSYVDADRGRQGLPPDVAALVTALGDREISLEIVNTSFSQTRRLLVRPGRFGERDVIEVRAFTERGGSFPGGIFDYTSTPGEPEWVTVPVADAEFLVELPPAHRAKLTIVSTPPIRPPRHYHYTPRTGVASMEKNQ